MELRIEQKQMADLVASGKGTSVAVDGPIMITMSTGDRVRIIDVPRPKLCGLVGGQLLEFGKGSCLCIDPFSVASDDNEEDP